MNHSEVPTVLNQLLRPLARSLPRYLEFARPWTGVDGKAVRDALASLVADQRAYALLVSEAVFEYGARPDPGPFPMEFTAIHDLALEFVLGRVVEDHRAHVDVIQRCSRQLESFPPLRSLADEVLSNAREHLAHGSLAIALAAEPRILLLDEPAAGMTAGERAEVIRLIQRIRAQGVTVLLVEHDMRLVMGISDHVIVLGGGRVIAEGSPDTIRAHPDVVRAYLGATHADA